MGGRGQGEGGRKGRREEGRMTEGREEGWKEGRKGGREGEGGRCRGEMGVTNLSDFWLLVTISHEQATLHS